MMVRIAPGDGMPRSPMRSAAEAERAIDNRPYGFEVYAALFSPVCAGRIKGSKKQYRV